MQPILHIDFESRSTVDLNKAGVYKYAMHPSTDIWCMAYAFGDEEPALWLMGEPFPHEVIQHVAAYGIIRAYNANFERIMWTCILHRRMGIINPKMEQFECVMARACAMALPPKLEGAAAALGISMQKDMAGHRLMMQMARPREVLSDGKILWWDDAGKRSRLAEYCQQDVRVEVELDKRVMPLPKQEVATYILDQKINDRGIRGDMGLALKARDVITQATELLDADMYRVTNGEVQACTNVQVLTNWLKKRGVAEVDGVAKEDILELLGRDDLPDDCRQALELRQEAAKASVAKINSMITRINNDGRLRGNLFYHGASTGRWAARGTQLQNLPRPKLKEKDIDAAVECLSKGNAQLVDMLFGKPLSFVSDCIRSMFLAAPGHDLISADFANIEGRVNAWLAGQDDLVRLFRSGGKVYEEMAASIYNIPVDSVKNPSLERQLGKTAVLGCGFGMGGEKFKATCKKDKIEISLEMAQRAVDAYREKNHRIKAFWYGLEDAAISAVESPGKVFKYRLIAFKKKGSFLWCRLPSGRMLCYPYPRLEKKETPWGEMKTALRHKGYNSMRKKWEDTWTYGGKLVENVVQGTARDIMAEAMHRVESAGYKIILTVHDEIISEVKAGRGSLDAFIDLMKTPPSWALDCPIDVAGWRGRRYRK